MHVSLDDYFLVLRGVLPIELLLQQAHRHLMEICPTCRKEWDGQPTFAPPTIADGAWTLEGLAARQPPADRDFDITLYEVEGRRRSRMRTLRRLAREDLVRLRRHPLERWPEVVTNATKRYRSHPFLLLLLEEARAVVRNDPREAATLAKLVPLILAQSPERAAQPWAWDVRARAVAHQANALRVAGDLPAAERQFADLGRELLARPLYTRRAEADVRSLEASLRIDQRLFADADRLLTAAAELASGAAASRVSLKHAHLLMNLGEAERALERFEEAAGGLDLQAQPLLHLSAVTGRVNCLCDLDRYEEAGGCWPPSAQRSSAAATTTSRLSTTSTRPVWTSAWGASTAPRPASPPPGIASSPSTATTTPSSPAFTSPTPCSPPTRRPRPAGSRASWCRSSSRAAWSGRR